MNPRRCAHLRATSSRLSTFVRHCRHLLLIGLLATVATARAEAQTPENVAMVVADGLSADSFHNPDDQIRSLLETLLAENPQGLSAWSRSRASFEQVAQARSLPDMQFTYRYFALTPETRVGPQEHLLEFSQGIPWAGKRALQRHRAEQLASGAGWEAQDIERQLVSDLKSAYFEAAYLQEALLVNAEEQELLRRFENIALTRYATGEGIQQSIIKVQTDISRLDDRAIELREHLDIMRRRISELIGRPEASLTLDPIHLALPHVHQDRDALEKIAAAVHPRVRAVERRVETDQILMKRRNLESRPDWRFGLGYTLVGEREDLAGIANPPQDNGMDVLALTVGLSIPVYRKRIRAGIAQAVESQQANEELLEAVRDRLRLDIQEAVLRLDSAAERGRLFHDVVIPQAEASLASAEAAYTTDRLGFLDLLDAERILFQSRLVFHRLVSDGWIALAALERAIGQAYPPNGPSAAAGNSTTKSGTPS